MLFGINWISPATLPMIRKLIDLGMVDFCEIMVDNFAHLPSHTILSALPDVPISLHIVSSRFLEKSLDEIKSLANYLRPWIKDLNPLYVSDHLVSFNNEAGVRLPFIQELDYDNAYLVVKERIGYWQEWLDTPLLFENHASLTARGIDQVSFFQKIIQETGANLLFDFSNAYIADHNQGVLRESWAQMVACTKHFHVAGFKQDHASGLLLDTHDASIDDEVLADIQTCMMQESRNKTLVIEFDANVNLALWQHNRLRINNADPPLSCKRKLNRIKTDDQTFAKLSYQNIHHRVFHLAHRLLTITTQNGDDLLQPFLQWACDQHLKMDWTMHIHLLTWLNQHPKWSQHLTEDIVKELLIASLIQWSLTGLDYPLSKGIIVASPYLQGLAVALWKSQTADATHKIVMLRHDGGCREPCYALIYEVDNLKNLDWIVIPAKAGMNDQK